MGERVVYSDRQGEVDTVVASLDLPNFVAAGNRR